MIVTEMLRHRQPLGEDDVSGSPNGQQCAVSAGQVSGSASGTKTFAATPVRLCLISRPDSSLVPDPESTFR